MPAAGVGQTYVGTGLMIGSGEFRQDALIGLLRNAIGVDRRLGALENHCFKKFVIPQPHALPDQVKVKTRLYHEFAKEMKTLATR